MNNYNIFIKAYERGFENFALINPLFVSTSASELVASISNIESFQIETIISILGMADLAKQLTLYAELSSCYALWLPVATSL